MTDRDEAAEKLASRFDTDNTDNLDNTDNSTSSENPDNPDNTVNPKEDWTGRMVYVPDSDDLDQLNAFDGEYQRFEYECDWQIRKQKHYYPVVIQHGISTIEEMDGEEFTECVDELGLR
ncbi:MULTISPECIES: hypothetical protein [Halobacteriales]|uniref:hypothetical protein n=1 Tax=Halobacteriales TaxID=2235 RepID=UPI000FE30677